MTDVRMPPDVRLPPDVAGGSCYVSIFICCLKLCKGFCIVWFALIVFKHNCQVSLYFLFRVTLKQQLLYIFGKLCWSCRNNVEET